MFDKTTRTAIQSNTNNFGDGLAGRGLGLNNTIADTAPAASRTRSRCCTTSPRRRPTCASCSSRSTAPPRRPRRSPTRNAAFYVRPRHLLHRLRRRRPLARSSDRGRSAVARTGDPLAAVRGAVHRKAAPSSCTCCARARALLRDRRPAARRTPFTVGAVNLRAATALNTQLAASSQALAGLRRRTRSSRSASKTSRRRSQLGNPLLAGARARAGRSATT